MQPSPGTGSEKELYIQLTIQGKCEVHECKYDQATGVNTLKFEKKSMGSFMTISSQGLGFRSHLEGSTPRSTLSRSIVLGYWVSFRRKWATH